MSRLEFTIGLIEALAWPSATVFMVFLFRKEVRATIPLLRRLKAGPVEAEFERELEEIKRESGHIIEHQADAHEPDPEDMKWLLELATASPKAAILESWLRLKSAMKEAAWLHAGSPAPDISSSYKLVKEIELLEILNAKEFSLLQDLRGLRNQVVHVNEFSINQNAARDYVGMASALGSVIRRGAKPNECNA